VEVAVEAAVEAAVDGAVTDSVTVAVTVSVPDPESSSEHPAMATTAPARSAARAMDFGTDRCMGEPPRGCARAGRRAPRATVGAAGNPHK
jgi:hypothetical protein